MEGCHRVGPLFGTTLKLADLGWGGKGRVVPVSLTIHQGVSLSTAKTSLQADVNHAFAPLFRYSRPQCVRSLPKALFL